MTLPRLYPILDAELVEARGVLVVDAAAALIAGGAGILQWRFKGQLTRARLAQLDRISELCRRSGVPLIVNDRADVALMVGDGLHVGQEDLPPADARRVVGSHAVLGFSTHNERQLCEAASEPVDYLALGPIFATRSKENPDPEVGLHQLHQWRPLSPVPLVAIGGITRDNVLAVLDCGADSVAVIGDLLPEQCTPGDLRRRMEQWQELVN